MSTDKLNSRVQELEDLVRDLLTYIEIVGSPTDEVHQAVVARAKELLEKA